MKIDFAKAYDSINAKCLLHVLKCMNFGPKWTMWISGLSYFALNQNVSSGEWFSHYGI